MNECHKCGREIIYHPINGRFLCSGCNKLVNMCNCERILGGSDGKY